MVRTNKQTDVQVAETNIVRGRVHCHHSNQHLQIHHGTHRNVTKQNKARSQCGNELKQSSQHANIWIYARTCSVFELKSSCAAKPPSPRHSAHSVSVTRRSIATRRICSSGDSVGGEGRQTEDGR